MCSPRPFKENLEFGAEIGTVVGNMKIVVWVS